MTPERLREIERLFHEARERPPTTVNELATLDSIIKSTGRTSRPPIAAALPRNTNLRLKSMGCVT